jgi:hypothetical protein
MQLLAHLDRLRAHRKLWVAPPGDIERWWRQRHAMRLVRDAAGWRLVGEGSSRARLAYAVLDGERVTYEVDDQQRGAPLAS